jgi:hypothetical protein
VAPTLARRRGPLFERGEIWLPESFYVTDWQKQPVDLVRAFFINVFMTAVFSALAYWWISRFEKRQARKLAGNEKKTGNGKLASQR